MSQDPSHDGADKGDVDEGDVVEVRLVPEFEGWRLLGVYALCVCVDSSGCAVGLVVGDFFYQLFNDTYYLLLSSYDFISCLPSFVTRFIYFIISNIIISKTYYSKIKKNGERSGNKLLRIKPRRNPADPR